MRYEASMVVDRPIEEVWAFLTDSFNLPRFSKPAALAFRQTSPGPIGVGTTYEGRFVIFGLERQVSAMVTQWDPPHTAVYSGGGMRLWGGSIRVQVEINLSRPDRHAPDRTKVVRVGEYELRGIWRLLSPILRLIVRRSVRTDNQNLKRLLEAGRG